MNPHLEPTPNPYSIETAVGLQSPIQPLNGSPTVVNHLPLRGLDSSSKCLPMAWIRVNDGFGAVSPLYYTPQSVTGVSRIADYVLGMESAVGIPGLPKQRGRHIHIVKITFADVYYQREFVLGVRKDMYLVTPNILLVALGVGLDHPASIGVRDLAIPSLASVRPRLDVGAVDGDGLPEVRERLIEPSGQATTDVPDQSAKPLTGKSSEETRERRLTRNLPRGVDTAGLGDVGVVVEGANQVVDRRQAQVVIGHETPPKNARIISFGATSPRAFELCQEFFIWKFIEDSPKLSNDRRDLSICKGKDTIFVGHREAHPSCSA